jgi:hypothetical protein
MKAKYLLVVLLSAILVVMTGCRTNPVFNIQDQNIVTNQSNYTEEDVKKAIVRAGSTLGWNMNADKPGHVLATLYLRDHMAQTDINYDLNSYNITYKDSSNLNYDASGDEVTIHSNYNGWIQNLDRAIKAQLSNL